MSPAARSEKGTEQTPGGSTPVSPMTIPLLTGTLVLGFLAGYFGLWWGLLVVAAVLLGAFSAVLAGRSRDAATAAVLGIVLGYGGVMLLAAFRGVL